MTKQVEKFGPVCTRAAFFRASCLKVADKALSDKVRNAFLYVADLYAAVDAGVESFSTAEYNHDRARKLRVSDADFLVGETNYKRLWA